MISDAERLGAGLEHGDGLRQAPLVDEEGVRLRLGDAMGERHGLGRGGRLVEQRGVGDIEPGQVADERLEVQQRLEAPLADLRLIRRVGGVPGRVLQDVALDRRRHDGAVIALADERGEHAVLGGGLAHPVERAAFRQRPAEFERRLVWRMSSGTVSSISASRLGAPTTRSISSISSGEGPMWRRLAKS